MADIGSIAEHVDVEAALSRYRRVLRDGMQRALHAARAAALDAPATTALLDTFHGQIEYHLGWRQPDLSPARANPGKLLRPTLVLLASEIAAARTGATTQERSHLVNRAVPAGVSVELVHNFSLVHDDIEDGDEERRHRPTLWKLWGVPQAINTGDGIFALARMELWRLVDAGVEPSIVVKLAASLDRTCLELCEGQFLDMSFEGRRDVTVAMYMDMINRKTASLMSCACEMGGHLGAPVDAAISSRLADFGRALGLAFQLRDDLLGIWAHEEQLGKVAAGDLRRKKMSLPVIHAMETATGEDLRTLTAVYAAHGPATDEQIAVALGVLERTGARQRVWAALQEQGGLARAALDAVASQVAETTEARELMDALVSFVTAVA